jgi:hypothetical protein
MTRVRLPPDPHSLCITTIIDSQLGDVALQSHCSAFAAAISTTHDDAIERRQSTTKVSDTELHRRSDTEIITGVGIDQSTLEAKLTTPRVTLDTSSSSSSSFTMDHVDSIVLVYDLDRTETFLRLENHWLPLIEKYYQGTVCMRIKLLSGVVFFCL